MDSAELKIDLISPQVVHSWWTPQLRTEPMKVDAQNKAGVDFHAKAAIQLAAVAFGHGFQAGINLKPVLGATFALSGSTSDACANDAEHHVLGVSVVPSAGISLNAEIAKASDSANPLAKITIADLKEALPDACVGFGPVVANSSLPHKQESTDMASGQLDALASDSSNRTPSSHLHSSHVRRLQHRHHHGRRH
ncbi:uncharacterized protein BDW43DRAFT_309991 [Aspergillus alliaceus]|uniref:uncharacterized protein n=1 Tax=Petromyces alliaceus TaxID=209559 RepID=UPI0012A55397|nr:uncharacterized protein BDW43DRAFT_309991 [Aspergillus alliaceus]KAB8234731.1 hypothetical protein BDW43DRAFT_309991 [Aspergillus alliaceus]